MAHWLRDPNKVERRTMDVSVIISTYNRPKDAIDCINSLLDSTALNFEIIVIDASPDIFVAHQLRKQFKNNILVKIVRSKKSIGLSRSRNLGVLLAKGDIVVFIDDDCIACSGWLQNLLSEFKTSKIAIVGGRSLPLFMSNTVPTWLNNRLFPALGISHYSNKRQTVSYVLGCNFGVRRELFDKLGMFREDLGRRGNLLLSNEEVEYCKRVKAAGYFVIYTHKATVKHKIYSTRLKRLYFLKRFFYGGLSEGLMTRHESSILFFFRNARAFLKDIIFFLRKTDLFSLCSLFEKLGLLVCILYRVWHSSL